MESLSQVLLVSLHGNDSHQVGTLERELLLLYFLRNPARKNLLLFCPWNVITLFCPTPCGSYLLPYPSQEETHSGIWNPQVSVPF